jgi:acetylcholinesterase
LTAYGGRDDRLFIGGIGQSAFFPTQRQVADQEFQFDLFAQRAGCAGASDELACLRSKNTSILQAANIPSAYPGATNPPRFYFTPCIDGEFIQDYPIRLFEQGKFVHVPVMFGDDTDEGSGFAANASTPADVAVFMVDQYPHLTAADTDAINAKYPLMAPIPCHAPYFPSASAAYGEVTFTCPSIMVLQSYVQYFDPAKTWSYRVNILQANNINSGLGVPHGFETPAIFGPGYADSPGSFLTYNAAIVPVIMNYWISFIRALNPNPHKFTSAPHWENYSDKQRRMVLQTNATAMEQVLSDQLTRCKFWQDLAATLEF